MSGAVGGIASFMGVQFASAARVEATAPNGYKLKRKASGEYVLMGAFQWTQGATGGIEWRELETEFEAAPEAAKHAPDCASMTQVWPGDSVTPYRMAACTCAVELHPSKADVVPAGERDPERHQYYYRVNGCAAPTAEDPKCICWHDEGTGPHEDARHDDEMPSLTWRVRRADQA